MPQRKPKSFVEYAIKLKQKKMLESALRQEAAANESVTMSETKIYIGLNDGETREQMFKTETYLHVLQYVCKNYHVGFSVDVERGGYFHDDGEFIEENSLVLVLLDADPDTVQNIAKDLCTFFNQESVLITQGHVDGYFILS